jgi:hypothetical protein
MGSEQILSTSSATLLALGCGREEERPTNGRRCPIAVTDSGKSAGLSWWKADIGDAVTVSVTSNQTDLDSHWIAIWDLRSTPRSPRRRGSGMQQ